MHCKIMPAKGVRAAEAEYASAVSGLPEHPREMLGLHFSFIEQNCRRFFAPDGRPKPEWGMVFSAGSWNEAREKARRSAPSADGGSCTSSTMERFLDVLDLVILNNRRDHLAELVRSKTLKPVFEFMKAEAFKFDFCLSVLVLSGYYCTVADIDYPEKDSIRNYLYASREILEKGYALYGDSDRGPIVYAANMAGRGGQDAGRAASPSSLNNFDASDSQGSRAAMARRH